MTRSLAKTMPGDVIEWPDASAQGSHESRKTAKGFASRACRRYWPRQTVFG